MLDPLIDILIITDFVVVVIGLLLVYLYTLPLRFYKPILLYFLVGYLCISAISLCSITLYICIYLLIETHKITSPSDLLVFISYLKGLISSYVKGWYKLN